MAVAPLPAHAELPRWKAQLYDDFKVEIPLTEWNGHKFARISIQAYNTRADVEALLEALRVLLKKPRPGPAQMAAGPHPA